MHQSQRKNDVIPAKIPLHFRQRPVIEVQPKKHFLQSVRKSFKMINAQPQQQFQTQRRRPSPAMRSFNRRQRPLVWTAKPKPMNVLIKPIVKPKLLETAAKRKSNDFYPAYPYKKQKRIKIIPAYDEYENYPEPDYVHEIVYPPEPRAFNYMEVEDSPNYGAPCDHTDSEIKEQSTEAENHPDISPKEMEDNSEEPEKEEEISTTKKADEPEVETEKEIEVTTPVAVVTETPIIDNDSRKSDGGAIGSPDESTNLMEMLLRGLLALISCIKSKTPVLDDVISNILNAAIKTCNTKSS